MQLEKLMDAYSVDNFRNDLLNDIDETKEGVVHMGRAHNRQIDEVLSLVATMSRHHEDSLNKPS